MLFIGKKFSWKGEDLEIWFLKNWKPVVTFAELLTKLKINALFFVLKTSSFGWGVGFDLLKQMS